MLRPVKPARWIPHSLTARFALAAAGLAALALILTSIASWWLINKQHQRALDELALHETQFKATSIANDLNALAGRMSEIAGSTILATALVDSAGRETYLVPFLNGIRQINGIPVQVLLTDFEGHAIASNGRDAFSAEELAWLKQVLPGGKPASRIFQHGNGAQLVAVEPMTYVRTVSPEGAVLYKVAMKDLTQGLGRSLEWSTEPDAAGTTGVRVAAPKVFEPLNLRVRNETSVQRTVELSVPYLHVFLIGVAIFCLVGVAGIRLARVLTTDIRRLEAFSQKVVGSGLDSERAPADGSIEVASLAHAINDMLDRLSRQQSTLLKEREKLTQLTQALQSADQRKDDFLAMLGHELRNPLAPIASASHLLAKLSASHTDPRVKKISEIIIRQAGQMTKLIADLLDVSRVTRGRISLDKTGLDMRTVLSAAVEQVTPLVEAAKHRVTISLPQEAAWVTGDPARLVQVASNLLTNAVKYTPQGGEIGVTLRTAGDEVEFSVHDNGIGISAALLPEVFELFTQGDRSIDRSQGGLGLGLALVKQLVELHGGRVQAHSEGVGQGATFTVTLPRAVPPPQPEPPVVPVKASARPQSALHVLVVDDNVDAALTLADWLETEGHAVKVAHDAQEALECASRDRFDVFILDIGLPVMDGYELARRLRSRPEVQGALLIALTGYGQASDRENSAAAGFDEHLVKPAEPEAIEACLERFKLVRTAAGVALDG